MSGRSCLFAFATTLVVACVLPHSSTPGPFQLSVPSGLSGPTTVQVVNATYSQLCGFRMWPATATDPGGNWVPEGRAFSPNRELLSSDISVGLRPGRYQLVADTCPTTTYEQYQAKGTVDIGSGTMRLVIDYDRPSEAPATMPEARITIPMTAWARQQMQNEEQLRNAPPPPLQGGAPVDQGCVSGLCDPQGTPCCAPYRCVNDPKLNWFCEA